MKFRIGVAVASLFGVGSASATTIQVPGDQPTIQGGIDAASIGDTVLVAPGTYTGSGNKNLDFDGVDLVLRSQGGADVTVIDCEGDGRGLRFHSFESSAAVVEGFTIRNGSVMASDDGGGIRCHASDPTITHCTITGNAADHGGGLSCYSSNPTLTHCTITENTAIDIDGNGGGGGLYCSGGSDPTLTHCQVTGNTTTRGGGVYCTSSDPTLTHCQVTDNTASDSGGGLFCAGSEPTLTNCHVTGNSAASDGGGVYCSYSFSTLTNCMITGNAAGNGGGVHCSSSPSPTLTGCTISGNTATLDGGGICCRFSADPTLTNCIVWGDVPQATHVDSGIPVVTYSDIEGGWNGIGNIDANPLLVDPGNDDYHLGAGSPCIDTGTSEGAPETDFEGDPRPWGAGYDMGADEYTMVGVTEPTPGLPGTRTTLADARPNPFNPYTTIPFELSKAMRVELAIYDARGALVRRLVHGTRPAGAHAVMWDGTNAVGEIMPSAAYIVRLTAGKAIEQRHLVLVK